MSFFKRRNREVSPNPTASTTPSLPDEKSGPWRAPSPLPSPPPAFDDSRPSTPPPPFPTRDSRIPTFSTTRVIGSSEPAPDARLPAGSFANEADMVTFLRTKRLQNPPKTAVKKKLDDVMGVLYGHEHMFDQGHERRPESGQGIAVRAARKPEKMSLFRRWADGYFLDEDCDIPSRWPEVENKQKS
ncbi:hypothetical protein HDU96_010717 [Phlyctochytrium bullatum]|nr:hypothetical protein HDU96_010717 [Phlyctochytrium bullatum]